MLVQIVLSHFFLEISGLSNQSEFLQPGNPKVELNDNK